MKRTSKKLSIVQNMPPCYHTRPGCVYDVFHSEVIQWLLRQPDVLHYLWDQVRQSGLVQYDAHTGQWKGVRAK